jgi:hypothetical protein
MDMHDIEDFIDEWFEAGNVPTKEMDRNLCWDLASKADTIKGGIFLELSNLKTLIDRINVDPAYWDGLRVRIWTEIEQFQRDKSYKQASRLRLVYGALQKSSSDLNCQGYIETAYLAEESGLSIDNIFLIFSKYLT